jgi:hypothetical protein
MTWSDWWPYLAKIVESDKPQFGVYELADENRKTIYFGSGNVKDTLIHHLTVNEYPEAKFYRVEYTKNRTDCTLKEEQLLSAYKTEHGKLPMYNKEIVSSPSA